MKKKAAKKKAAKKSRNPAAKSKAKRANTKTVYRFVKPNATKKHKKKKVRRNPASLKAITDGLQNQIPDAFMFLLGFIGSKFATNAILPSASNYIKALLQVTIGIGGSMVSRKNGNSIAAGGIAAGILTLIDTVTAAKYRGYYNMGDYVFMPASGMENAYAAIPAALNGNDVMGEYLRIEDAAMGEYVASRFS
jgi:hypothetical protein